MAYRDKERQKATERLWELAHREERNAQKRAARKAQPEKAKARDRAYNQAHRKQRKAYNQAHTQALKLEVFKAYGGAECLCCHETMLEFLTLDHIANDGAEHRRQSVGKGSAFYHWLKQQGYPPGIRVLCFNCNCALGLFGYCPHRNVRVEAAGVITTNGNSSHAQQLSLEILA